MALETGRHTSQSFRSLLSSAKESLDLVQLLEGVWCVILDLFGQLDERAELLLRLDAELGHDLRQVGLVRFQNCDSALNHKRHSEEKDEGRIAALASFSGLGGVRHSVPELEDDFGVGDARREVSNEPGDGVHFGDDVVALEVESDLWVVVRQKHLEQAEAGLERVKVVVAEEVRLEGANEFARH